MSSKNPPKEELEPTQSPDADWTVISSADMHLLYEPPSEIYSCRARLPDGTILHSNIPPFFNPIGNDDGFKHFLIDQADVNFMGIVYQCAKTEENKIMSTKRILSSVKNLCTHFPEKKIYIRTFPYPETDRLPDGFEQPPDRVFGDEVAEMIPALLLKQGKTVDEDLFRVYSRALRGNIDHVYRTIPLDCLARTMDEFGIDKSLITLVPDPLYTLTSTVYHNSGGHICTVAPDYQMTTDVIQSMNRVFWTTIIGVNWRIETCRLHRNCMNLLKWKIIKLLNLLREVRRPRFINHIFLDNQIEAIRKMCTFKYPVISIDRNYHFRNFRPEANINVNAYTEIAKEFDIPRYLNFLPGTNKKMLPVWMVRVFYKLGVIEQFFEGKTNYENQNALIINLLKSVPKKHVKRTKEILELFMGWNDEKMEVHRDPAGGKVAFRRHYLEATRDMRSMRI